MRKRDRDPINNKMSLSIPPSGAWGTNELFFTLKTPMALYGTNRERREDEGSRDHHRDQWYPMIIESPSTLKAEEKRERGFRYALARRM